ncbi:MAG: phage portal protein, partial [Deltaproteobacteria bacterium]|nr:phage portal protein [Deltaproteobacteria bacterium]
KICDFQKQDTFGALQRIARREALIEGDILVVIRQSRSTGLPSVQLISGSKVQTPLTQTLRQGNKIIHGVEVDKNGRHVAYWILQEDNTSKRLPAFGERSGRRIAWLVYGADKRKDEVRGEPLLSLILQSLKEIDRYRDSAQRKAVINSILAMFIQKDEDKPGTKPIGGGVVRKDTITATDPDGSPRDFNIASAIPGMVVEELQHGEVPKAFGSDGTDVNFGVFEAALIQAIAWANEIPPEVLTLSFQSNYSASRGAVNEFKMYLDKSRSERADEFGIPIYTEWLLSEVLRGKIKAPGLLEAWRNPSQYDIFAAWVSSDWAGAIKPSVDIKKEAQGYELMIKMGGITRSRMARELNGMKFSKVAEQLKKENELLAEATRPLLELAAEFGVPVDDVLKASNDSLVEDIVEDTLRLVAEGEG